MSFGLGHQQPGTLTETCINVSNNLELSSCWSPRLEVYTGRPKACLLGTYPVGFTSRRDAIESSICSMMTTTLAPRVFYRNSSAWMFSVAFNVSVFLYFNPRLFGSGGCLWTLYSEYIMSSMGKFGLSIGTPATYRAHIDSSKFEVTCNWRAVGALPIKFWTAFIAQIQEELTWS